MADEKELQVKIRFISDVSGVKDSRKATEDIKSGNKATGEGAEQAESKVKNLGKSLDNLTKISATMAVVSGLALKGMSQAIDSYTKSVGSTEAASKRWMLLNQSNEESMVRMGRSVTQAATPWMEKYSSFLDNTAQFMEQHPEVVEAGTNAALGIGAMGIVGGAIKIGSSLVKGVGGLLGGLGGGGAAATGAINTAGGVGASAAAYAPETAATAAVGGVIGSVLSVAGGVGLGFLANEALANSDFGKKLGVQNFGKIATAASYLINRAKGQEHAEAAYNAATYGQSIGAIPGGKQKQTAASNHLTEMAPQIIAYAQYYRQEENALRAHLITLARANRDFQIQQEYEVQDYTRQRSRSVRDFNRQENQNVFEYQRQRAIAVRDFNIGILRSEQDYQKQRTRAGEDFQFQLWDIARSGDAFAYMQATRQFNLQQSRGEEDYNLQRSRQVEDFDRQQTDQEDSFNIQRSFRMQSFQISQVDQEEDFTIRRDREFKQRALQIQDQQQDFDEQKRLRRQAITDTLNDMADGTTKAGILMGQFTEGMVSDMQYLANGGARLNEYFSKLNLPNGAAPSRDIGGYVDKGLYQMHDNEFVLNASTTKALEQLGGGGLTQGGVLGMLGRGGGASITINDQRKFDSRLSADDRQAIRRENVNMLQEVFGA